MCQNGSNKNSINKLSFCTGEVPVFVEGQNFSPINYMNPITKILYHSYTIAACNPLYPNVVKLEDGSFQQYEETLKNSIVRYISGR